MILKFSIAYKTEYRHTVCITGNLPALGSWDENKALPLQCSGEGDYWYKTLEIEAFDSDLEYCYLIKEGGRIIRREQGRPRRIVLAPAKDFYLTDSWHDAPAQKYLYTSAFSKSFFKPAVISRSFRYYKNTILISLICPYVDKEHTVVLTGEGSSFGCWDISKSVRLKQNAYAGWFHILNADKITEPVQYKFAIVHNTTLEVEHWEEGDNRVLYPLSKEQSKNAVQSYDLVYRRTWFNWKSAGVVVPVFSLRTKKSFGTGEFSDLKKLIDWAAAAGMKVIQTLPVNDTTISHTWADSYPYNAISIYALHPLYLGLSGFPLKDKKKLRSFKKQAALLNELKELDYEKVLKLKEAYLEELFRESGEETIRSDSFAAFYRSSESWLFPYACFCYLRDKYHTADPFSWKTFSRYNKKSLQHALDKHADMKRAVEAVYFTQYLLHRQLSDVKEYAHAKGIVLKGDIPIGISRSSVEAWVEPHLFNLDTQTGAPPDDFSIFGQNWGFPTYNWPEMAKNGYKWWINRFRKMADYFDVYRIDHILGFFRIWEIPLHSVQGLLGRFSPALPYSLEEIYSRGLIFDEYRMAVPYIHEHFLQELFGSDTPEVVENFLNRISWQQYGLKEFCNTQEKIRSFFENKDDVKNSRIREGLYRLCNEVLFVRDKHEPNKYHPRITAQYTYSYNDLAPEQKDAFNRLYDHFYYERHNEFWRSQAMKKLPPLISSTDMLVCGEDLGMIPDCVPPVMRELQILSLEIERMPKHTQGRFENLSTIPYLSVCTTSTHDMPPIRAWWVEDKDITQQYYNEVLRAAGEAPDTCTPEICRQIIANHLNSNAMLAIFPLQDWLAMDGNLRRENPFEERINIPAVAKHYWQYRMHLNVEDLLGAEDFNKEITAMLKASGRL